MVLLDYEGMPYREIAGATVDIAEAVPAAVLFTFEDLRRGGVGTRLGAIGSWDSKWMEADLADSTKFESFVAYLRDHRRVEIEEPDCVARRIARAAGRVTAINTPPAHLLLGVEDLPAGWRLLDQAPPRESARATAAATSCLAIGPALKHPGWASISPFVKTRANAWRGARSLRAWTRVMSLPWVETKSNSRSAASEPCSTSPTWMVRFSYASSSCSKPRSEPAASLDFFELTRSRRLDSCTHRRPRRRVLRRLSRTAVRLTIRRAAWPRILQRDPAGL